MALDFTAGCIGGWSKMSAIILKKHNYLLLNIYHKNTVLSPAVEAEPQKSSRLSSFGRAVSSALVDLVLYLYSLLFTFISTALAVLFTLVYSVVYIPPLVLPEIALTVLNC